MKLNPQSKPPAEEKLSRAWTIPLGAAHVGTRLNPTDSTAERKWPDEGIFGQNLARRILGKGIGMGNVAALQCKRQGTLSTDYC